MAAALRMTLAAGLLAASLVGAVGQPGLAQSDPPPPVLPEPTHHVVALEAMVEMDDGVRLAVTYAFPSANGSTPLAGPFPAVLSMTPYGRNGVCGCPAPATWAQRGMVGIVADVRGTGGSEGDLSENYFSPREARDTAILIEHLAAQPWSNGRVGMAGGSYVGITQLRAAGEAPEHLAAIVPQVAISDLYRDGFTHGGVPNFLFDVQYIGVQGAPGTLGVNTDPNLLDELVAAKLGQSPPGAIAFDYLARPNDDPFYRDRSPITNAQHIDVPTLIIGAWHDGLLRGSTEMFDALEERPGVETRLFMDPCTHKGCGVPFAPFHEAPGEPDLLALIFEFLADHLADQPAPERPRVQVWVQGREQYLLADTWPPAGTQYASWLLSADGLLAPGEPSTGDDTASYVTNPAAGVANTFSQYGTVGATPYVPPDQRLEGPNGLTFRTAPLDEPLTLVGPIALHLVAASTATDTDWHVRLADVAPDGTETIIIDGSLRASHRELDPTRSRPERPWHTHVDPQPIEPGAFVDYDIEIWPTAWELPAGHRLQLRLTSVDLPTHFPGWIRFDREDPAAATVVIHEPATNTVRLGASHLVLPVLHGSGPADPPSGTPGQDGQAEGQPSTPSTGGGLGLAAMAVLAAALVRRRSHPHAPAGSTATPRGR